METKFTFSVKQLVRICGIFVVYIAAAQLSRILFFNGTAPALIWLPAGIAWAALILWGSDLWPVIAIASLVYYLLNGTPLANAIVGSAGATLEAFVATYLLQKIKFDRTLSRFYDIVALLVTALFITMIVPTVGTLITTFTAGHATITWNQRWLGELLSVVILTPLILRWDTPWRERITWKIAVETFFAFAILIGATFLSSWTTHVTWSGISVGYLTIAALIWIALRMDMRAITTAMLLTTAIALGGIAFSGIPATIPGQSIGDRLIASELALVVFQFIFLTLAAVMQERNKAKTSEAQHVVQLEEALEKIKDENQGKNDFIAMLAHELRNPLASVRSYLELIKITGVSGETADFVGIAERNTVHMGRILDDLLDISRISQQKFELHKKRLSLQEVVKQSLELTAPILKKRGHAFLLKMPEETIWIDADPVRMEQVISNILLNAIKYTPENGAIELLCSREEHMATVRVKDNGMGIDPVMLTRIFDPYVQMQSARSKGGVGIGLSLSKKLVELHGGTIEAKSAGLRQGSEFVIRLPVVDGVLPSAAPSTSSTTPVKKERSVHSGSYRILVVDDNKAAADGLGKLLRYAGHVPEVVYSGEAALEKAVVFSPDVIVLDIGLPGMDGYEVAKKLRAGGSPAVLIALTGYGQAGDKLKAKNAGFDHHLTKPIALADIEKVLRSIGAGAK